MSFPLKQWSNEWSNFISEVLDDGAESKLLTWVEKLADDGPELRRHVKALGGGLYELKIRHGTLAFRCMYGFHLDCIVVVLCFTKKRQRDQDAVAEARRRLKLVKAGNVDVSNASIH